MTRPLWTIGDLLAESEGRLFADGRSANTPITGIKIDSRECGVGDLFVALSGGQRDGHEFLQSAAAANAAAALVKSPDRNADIAQIIVNDSLTGLTRLASAGRRRQTSNVGHCSNCAAVQQLLGSGSNAVVDYSVQYRYDARTVQ